MLPLSLLKTAENHPMLIEMKNGDTYNGRLVSCNMFMNICLRDVICTSKVCFYFNILNYNQFLRVSELHIFLFCDVTGRYSLLEAARVLY
jgi:small nuclear ribonucleoprotein (snRNP)-like protein